MTEFEKIEYAKTFIDKLANGINPLDDTPIPDTDIANQVRLSRCFFYVSDILRQVLENGGISASKSEKHRKKAFALTDEEKSKIEISDLPLSVREISEHLNAIIDLTTTKKISATTINNWLLSLEMIEVVTLPGGKHRKAPTKQGNEIGIFTEERTGSYGTYFVVLFSAQAQQFIYDHLEEIIGMKKEREDPLSEFHGRPWTEAHDECLIDLFRKNVPLSEMAFTLKRTDGGIRARLKKLGLIENRNGANEEKQYEVPNK